MAAFANILKTLRTERQLSQLELATRLGISKSAVSMIADIFQVDVDYLLGRTISSLESEPVTIAAHLDTSDLTQAELDDVAEYIRFIRSKRKQ